MRTLAFFLSIASLTAFASDKPAPQPTQAPAKLVLVDEQVLQAILAYMASQPYQETYQLIPMLQQGVKPFVKEEVCKAEVKK